MVIRDLAFNQDFTSLLMSTDENHKIFNCDPFGEIYALPSTTKEKCPTAFLRMLFSTSLTFIVPYTASGCRILKVFNLKLSMKICELTFSLNIVDLKINRKRLMVFLELGQIYIYDLSTIRLVKIVEVNFGRKGNAQAIPIADLSADDNSLLVLPLLALNDQSDLLSCDTNPQSESQPATPVLRPSDSTVPNTLDSLIELTQKNNSSSLVSREGITLEDLQHDSPGWILVYDTVGMKPRLIYKAHDAAIAKISISADSKCIATALTKGTIIRVCHLDPTAVAEGSKLKIEHMTNLRRGHNATRVTTLGFSANTALLGCASESGTIHFFAVNGALLNTPEKDVDAENEESEDLGRSLEDLNENLANLLLVRPPEEQEKEDSGYLGAFKRSARLLNNLYTKLIARKLPYREYLGNLIWEAPRRSFAHIRLPEYVPGTNLRQKAVEIGFSNSGSVMLASYNTGTLYHYRLPDINGDREECGLLSLNTLWEI